jgi:hypothetical protein
LQTDTDQYESTAFISSICEAFFWIPDSPMIRFHKKFKIMLFPAVVFVLTMVRYVVVLEPNLTHILQMQACVEEWSSRSFKAQDLHSPTQQPIFDAHLQGLLEYEEAAPGHMHEFQAEWFKVGMWVPMLCNFNLANFILGHMLVSLSTTMQNPSIANQ